MGESKWVLSFCAYYKLQHLLTGIYVGRGCYAEVLDITFCTICNVMAKWTHCLNTVLGQLLKYSQELEQVFEKVKIAL